jgi:hypothetical protein
MPWREWFLLSHLDPCILIIMMHLLHVHMLDIVQVMCNKRLGPNCMCIPKALQCLAFGTLSKFVTKSYCNVVFFLLNDLFWSHSIWTTKWVPKQCSHQLHLHPTRGLSICSREEKPLQQPSPLLSHRWKSRRVVILMIMGLAAFFGITCLSMKFQSRHTMNDVPCHTTHVYAFKHDHLASRLIHMYSPLNITFFWRSEAETS